MRTIFSLLLVMLFFSVTAQEERDTVLRRCPVYIMDTANYNNFFLEFQPSTIRVYRANGKLTISVQQKDQFFTIFFRDKHLNNARYKIAVGDIDRDEAEVKYSFRSGSSASFVNVSSGIVESEFDKEKDHWHLKVNGMLTNIAGRTVSYYKVKADFYIR